MGDYKRGGMPNVLFLRPEHSGHEAMEKSILAIIEARGD